MGERYRIEYRSEGEDSWHSWSVGYQRIDFARRGACRLASDLPYTSWRLIDTRTGNVVWPALAGREPAK